MKTWLRKYERAAVIAVCLVIAAFLGVNIYGVYYEPERCALCGYDMKYHAPVILDLSSGEVAEMQVYEPHPYLVGEIADVQSTGDMGLSMSAGIMMYTDPGKSCRATVPKNNRKMKNSLYCRKCRALLSAISTKGYVLLDLYDLNNIKAYPITAGAEYDIRDYSVTIATDENQNGQHIKITAYAN